MVDPVSAITVKVLEFLVSAFAGKEIDKWLSDRKKKKAFEKSLEQALIKVSEAGFTIRGPGGLDESFLTNELVTKELWAKLLDPTIDEEINYGLLEKELKGIYEDVSIGPREIEAIEFFVDALMDQMWSQDVLRDLLTTKIIKQHDLRFSLAKKKVLVRDYLRAEGQRIKCELDEEIGEGNRYVEPLIEKKEEKKEREERKLMERLGEKEAESFIPIDMNTYFIESSDRKVVVVADSGYGKTTLLKELLVRISDMFQAKTFGVDTPIPIYFTPSQAAECSEANIVNKVTTRLMASRCRETKVRQFVQDGFQTGRFIFLIDALDQVSERQNLLGALEGRCFRDNRVVLTTRPNVYEMEKGHLGNYVYLRIREFDEDRWVEYLGKEKLEALREIVDEEFLSVPILLKLVVEFWLEQDEKIKPVKNRSELYSQMFDKLLERQEHIDSEEQRPLSDIKSDLRILAHDTLVKGYLGQFPRDEAREQILNEERLNDLEARRWIFETAKSGEELAFRHRSFQEYLAAEYLNLHIKTEDDLDKLESYLYHPNWEESIRFLTGVLPVKTAERLINIILNIADGKPLAIYRDHLRLAALCLREIGEAGQNQRNAVIDLLRKDIKDPILQDTAISTLPVLRGEESVEILRGLLSHEDSDVRERAVEALGEIKSEVSVESLIQALKDKDVDSYVRGRTAEALGKIKSEVSVESLSQALKDESSYVRESAASALGEIKSEVAVESLIQALKDEGSFVRGRAADALGKSKSEVAVESLIQALKDEDSDVRGNAAESLGEIKSEVAVESLIQALKDEDSDVRWSAAYALGEIKFEVAVESLIQALKDKDSSVRRRTAYSLGEIKSEVAVESLIQALKDEDSGVRWSAAYALGEIKSEVAVESLILVLKDESSSVRWKAAEALGKIKSENAVESLIQALKDESSSVRRSAASALGAIKSDKVVQSLIKALGDEDSDVRRSAAYALRKIKSEVAVESLIQALNDDDSDVRRSAASALGQIKSQVAVESLIQALKDEGISVRRRAAEALGKIKSEVAVESLIHSLKDGDISVRWSAAEALGEIKSEVAVESLILVLKDESSSVRWKAAEALGKIKSENAVESLIQALKDESSSVRRSAASALGAIKSEVAVEPLIQALRDKSPFVRRRTADALGEIGTSGVLAKLVALWNKKDPKLDLSLLLRAIQTCDRKVRSEQPIKPIS